MSWVFDSVRGVKPSERLVLLSIANHANAQGADAWPSKETIAAEADLSVDTVDRAVASLRALGVLTVEVQAGGDSRCPPHRRPNRYALNLSWTAPPAGHRTHGGPRTPSSWGGQDAPPMQAATPPQDAGGTGGQDAGGYGGATCPPKPSLGTVPKTVNPLPPASNARAGSPARGGGDRGDGVMSAGETRAWDEARRAVAAKTARGEHVANPDAWMAARVARTSPAASGSRLSVVAPADPAAGDAYGDLEVRNARSYGGGCARAGDSLAEVLAACADASPMVLAAVEDGWRTAAGQALDPAVRAAAG